MTSLADYLGPCASVPPSPAAAKAIRMALLSGSLPNPMDTGAQSSPRNVPGKWPDAYGIHHAIVTPAEMRPRWDAWIATESTRGLGHGGPYPPGHGTYEVLHYTVTQHWLIGLMHDVAVQRKLSMQQAVELRVLLNKDKIAVAPTWAGASRGLGWCAQGAILDNLLTKDGSALGTAVLILDRVQQAHGVDNGVPFIWRNPAALKDPNHAEECSTWMDSTVGMALAQTYDVFPTPQGHDLLIHWLSCTAYAQKPDGSFHSDYGWNTDDTPSFHDNPKDATQHWVWPALHAAKHALGGDWPVWAEKMLNLCKDRWANMNAMKPTDSGFKDLHNMGVAIACAPAWGWRQ